MATTYAITLAQTDATTAATRTQLWAHNRSATRGEYYLCHIYSDSTCETEVEFTKLTDVIPSRLAYTFNGYWSSASGGEIRISSAGYIYDSRSTKFTGNETWRPHWTRVSYVVTLDAQGGTGGTAALYVGVSDNKVYSDDQATTETGTVTVPTRDGFAFCDYCNTNGNSVIDENGAILAAFGASEDCLMTARWDRVRSTITYSTDGATTETRYYRVSDGTFWADAEMTVSATALPTRLTGRTFVGGYSAASGGTAYINADGSVTNDFTEAAEEGDVTVHCSWTRVSWRFGETDADGFALHYRVSGGGWYEDDLCTGSAVTEIDPPVISGYRFDGYYHTVDASTSNLFIDDDGALTAYALALAPTADGTLTVAKSRLVVIVLRGNTDANLYYNADTGEFSTDDEPPPVTSVPVPVSECFRFLGYYTASSGGTQVIGPTGEIPASYAPSENDTLHAQWERATWKAHLQALGGTGGTAAVYSSASATGTFYSDDQATTPLVAITVPAKTGYTFDGYVNGDTAKINPDGTIVSGTTLAAIEVWSAVWTANEYTLAFDYNGGTQARSSQTVTYGEAVGSLPVTSRTGYDLAGFYVGGTAYGYRVAGGERIDADTVWLWAANKTAIASWTRGFGDITDYFGLGSASLIPVAADAGDNRQRICASQTGRRDASAVSAGAWRNPRVTYRVVGDCTVAVTLGKAWKKTGTTISGYMVTSVEIVTQVGEPPTVTVEGTANEGANAINLFSVSVPVTAAAHAQNLLGAVSGGGELQALTLRAACQPVVCAEDLMPCASDVVDGRIEITATTVTTDRESAPTAGSGFTLTAAPRQEADGQFTAWAFAAQKDL